MGSRLAVTLTECGRPAETGLRSASARTGRRNLRLRGDLVLALNGQGRHTDAPTALEALPHIDAAAPAGYGVPAGAAAVDREGPGDLRGRAHPA